MDENRLKAIPLFYAEGTTMLFGDAKKSVTEVAEELKAL